MTRCSCFSFLQVLWSNGQLLQGKMKQTASIMTRNPKLICFTLARTYSKAAQASQYRVLCRVSWGFLHYGLPPELVKTLIISLPELFHIRIMGASPSLKILLYSLTYKNKKEPSGNLLNGLTHKAHKVAKLNGIPKRLHTSSRELLLPWIYSPQILRNCFKFHKTTLPIYGSSLP